jgi:hypothetical protein
MGSHRSFLGCLKTGAIAVLTAVVSFLVIVAVYSSEASPKDKIYWVVIIVITCIVALVLEIRETLKRKRKK